MISKPLVIAAIAVVVIGGGYLAISHSSSDKAGVESPAVIAATGTVAATEPIKQDASGRKMAFGELIKQKGTYKCSVSQHVGNIDSKGTVYLNEENLRGEFLTKVQSMSIDTTIIVKDGFTYTWSSMAPTMGFKIPIAKNASAGGAQMSGTYSWNADQIGEYNCEAWSADAAKFELPAGVKFSEVK